LLKLKISCPPVSENTTDLSAGAGDPSATSHAGTCPKAVGESEVVGDTVGAAVSSGDRMKEGTSDISVAVGLSVGVAEGFSLGASVGAAVGFAVDSAVGLSVGVAVGFSLGASVGAAVGAADGAVVVPTYKDA
jgi:hypothetical protein